MRSEAPRSNRPLDRSSERSPPRLSLIENRARSTGEVRHRSGFAPLDRQPAHTLARGQLLALSMIRTQRLVAVAGSNGLRGRRRICQIGADLLAARALDGQLAPDLT